MQGVLSNQDQLPDFNQYSCRESALELARRSLLGAPVYTVISIIMLVSSPLLMRFGAWAYVEMGLLVALGAVRVVFAIKFPQRYDTVGEKAVLEFSIMTALQSLALGVLSAIIIWQYWATKEVILTMVLSAGCIAAGTSALSVRTSAHVIFLACVLLPFGIAVYLVSGIVQTVIIIGFLTLMAFLVQDGGQAKRAYFERLKEHYNEHIERRRVALEAHAREEFIRDIAHEIRAPVNSIVGMSTLLLEEEVTDKVREIGEVIRDGGHRLLGLMNNAPNAVAAKQEIAQRQVGVLDLKHCVNSVIDLYRPAAEEKGIKVVARYEDIPEDVVFCDEERLRQVLANLLSNAVQYTEYGGVTCIVESHSLDDGAAAIEFSIADTGVGIPEEHRESVFFTFDADDENAKERYGGEGLGLPLSKALVELLGGDIWIEGNGDHGIVVKFTVRAEYDPADESAGRPDERLDDDGDQAATYGDINKFTPHRILVVDDDEIHRQIVCVQLKKMGYDADEAADGEQAVATVLQASATGDEYDMVLMDIRMPNMDGIEASRWIRERFTGLPEELKIIAITGDATIEAREKCLRAGMDNFVTKPIQVKDLEALLAVNSATRSARTRGAPPKLRSVGSIH